MSLSGARVMVVGASSGIGRSIGLHAAMAGAGVVFSARRAERLEEVATEAGSGHAVALDVTDEASVVRGVAEAARLLGGLDVVVYASGVASMSALRDERAESWRRMFDTNVVGAALTAREAIPALERRGVMLFCSSSNTHRRLWGLNGYGATKAALDRLVDGLRDEHPSIRFVRTVIGSTFGTEFGDAFDGAVIGEAMPRWVATGQQTAGMMQPDDVGSVVTAMLATLHANPGVDIPELPIDPAGGLLTVTPTPEMMAKAFESMFAG